MCTIAVLPQGTAISKREFDNCWNRNRDGGGIMYAHEGRVLFVKGLMSKSRMWKAYREIAKQYKDTTVCLHFRIGTSGGKKANMTHPFPVKQFALMHNGVLHGLGSEKESDTAVFAGVLRKLPKGWQKDKVIGAMIEAYAVSTRSKFVVMLPSGKAKIYNPGAGVWNATRWFSNYDYTGMAAYPVQRRVRPATKRRAVCSTLDLDYKWDARCDGCRKWFSSDEIVQLSGLGRYCTECAAAFAGLE